MHVRRYDRTKGASGRAGRGGGGDEEEEKVGPKQKAAEKLDEEAAAMLAEAAAATAAVESQVPCAHPMRQDVLLFTCCCSWCAACVESCGIRVRHASTGRGVRSRGV